MAKHPPVNPGMTVTNAQWWRAEELGSEPHELLEPVISKIRTSQRSRYEAYRFLAEAYGADMSAFGGKTDHFAPLYNEELTMNELANTTETLHAQLFKNKIVPSPSTSNADYSEYRRAKKAGRWLDGIYDDTKVHEEAVPVSGMEMLLYGTGCFAVGNEVNGKQARLTCEPVPIADVEVDMMEGRYRKPRSMTRRMQMDRWVALEKFGKDDPDLYGDAARRRDAILSATPSDPLDQYGKTFITEDSDQIILRESWHLPTADGKDGRHVIWIEGCTLFAEEWKRRRIPLIFMRYGIPVGGFWGQSAVLRLVAGQRSYDKLNQRVDLAHDLLGSPKLIVRTNSGVELANIDDVPGTIITVDDPQAVKEWNPTPITQDAYRERDSLPQRMRNLLGTSQFSATNQLPVQLREASGVSIENWQDSEDLRQAMGHRSYESAMMELADVFLDEAEALDDAGYSIQARSANGADLDIIDFSEVRMDRERMKLRILPVSQLSRSFSGKLNQLNQLKAEGAISMATYRRMTQVPDLEAENDLDTSFEDIVDANLEYMVANGEYLAPTPFDDFDLIISRGTKFYNKQRVRKAENLQLIEQYINDAHRLKKEIEAQNAPPPQAPAPPGAGPMPAPGPVMPVPPGQTGM